MAETVLRALVRLCAEFAQGVGLAFSQGIGSGQEDTGRFVQGIALILEKLLQPTSKKESSLINSVFILISIFI